MPEVFTVHKVVPGIQISGVLQSESTMFCGSGYVNAIILTLSTYLNALNAHLRH